MRRLTPTTLISLTISFSATCHYSKRRKIFSYDKTNTPSVGPLSSTPENATLEDTILRYQENIIYHAESRVKLFFLLCIFYHNQKLTLITGRTTLQHGKGNSKDNLAACHSSLFPRLIECPPYQFIPTRNSLLEKTKLYHDNNMTVCLPTVVNDVDRFFEGYSGNSFYRKAGIHILNHSSLGFLKPDEALIHFLNIMKKAFFEKERFMANDTPDERKIHDLIFKIQEHGTFNKTMRYEHLNNHYIYKTLERNVDESIKAMYKRTQQKILNTSYSPKKL